MGAVRSEGIGLGWREMTQAAAKRLNYRADRRSGWQTFVEVLLVVAVCFVTTGDAAPNVNEAHYLSRLKHYWNPAWCAGDKFLDSTDTQLVFIWLFGWVTRFV